MTKKEKELLEWVEVMLINSPSDKEWRNDAIDLIYKLDKKNEELEKKNELAKDILCDLIKYANENGYENDVLTKAKDFIKN